MIGHSKMDILNEILWPDAQLQGFEVGYDDVVIRIRESTGRLTGIRCCGFIGFAVLGFWDEMLVDSVDLVYDHPILNESIDRLRVRMGDEWIDSGNVARNERSFSAFVLRLIDGCSIEVAASYYRVI